MFDMKNGCWIETLNPTLKDPQEEEPPVSFLFFSFATWKIPKLQMNSSRYNASNKSLFEFLILRLSIEVQTMIVSFELYIPV